MTNSTWNYTIHFKVPVPDLTIPVLQDYLTVESTLGDDVVVVKSTVNDEQLKELIASTCQLEKGDFAISGGFTRVPIWH